MERRPPVGTAARSAANGRHLIPLAASPPKHPRRYREPPVQNLYGLSRTQLIQVARDLGLPPYRGRQLFRHLYHHGQTDFEEMTDFSAPLRAELASRFRIAHPRLVESSESGDGAVKLLIELQDGLLVETVAIGSRRDAAGGRSGRAQGAGGDPSDLTVCVSTQVGCPLACTFCRSGAIEFRRNLTPGEIAAQVLMAERANPSAAKGRRNVVYMGMGEPLLNTDGVIASLDLLTDLDGFGIPPRRITVSTVGLPEEMGKLGGAAPQVGIAISLHAGDDETREKFMPIGRRHRMPEIFAALENAAFEPPNHDRVRPPRRRERPPGRCPRVDPSVEAPHGLGHPPPRKPDRV